MNTRELDRYKKLLLEKQEEMTSAVSDNKGPIPPAGGSEGDFMDRANADLEAGLQIRLKRTDGRLMRAIEEALVRIEQGNFGVCKECGQPISKARLEAVPWTRQCRECKERAGG